MKVQFLMTVNVFVVWIFSALSLSHHSTYRDHLHPYSWVGNTLIKIICSFVHVCTHLRHVYLHMRVLTSKQKLKPEKSWSKQLRISSIFSGFFGFSGQNHQILINAYKWSIKTSNVFLPYKSSVWKITRVEDLGFLFTLKT